MENDTIATHDAANRTVRGTTQNSLAGALVTLFVYFLFERRGDSLPAVVVISMTVVVAAVVTFAQNIYENKTGRAFLKNVPEEPAAAAADDLGT